MIVMVGLDGFFVGDFEGFKLGRALGVIVGKAGIVIAIVHFVNSFHLINCLFIVSTFLDEMFGEEKSEGIVDAKSFFSRWRK